MAFLQFTEPASEDLNDIAAFIQQDNPAAALRLLAALEDKCRLLATQPMLGRSQASLRPNMRSHPHGNYVVFYRPIDGDVEIVRVLHGARDIDAAFTE